MQILGLYQCSAKLLPKLLPNLFDEEQVFSVKVFSGCAFKPASSQRHMAPSDMLCWQLVKGAPYTQ